MSTLVNGSLSEICRAFGMSTAQVMDSHLDLENDVAGAVAVMDRHIAKHDAKRPAGKRMDAKQRHDAASVFTTSPLAAVLTSKRKISKEQFLFAPGRTGERGGLLPVSSKAKLGQTTIEWEVDAISGEARWIGAGGLRGLTRSSQANEKKEQPVALYGARFGWNSFDLWRAELIGQNIPADQQAGAVDAMDQHFERAAGFGSDEREQPGFFTHGCAYTFALPLDFLSVTTVDQLLINLQIIDEAWYLANPNRAPSGVIMPRSHWAHIQRIFMPGGNSLISALLVEEFPWLANPVRDNRMLTASSSDGAMWQLWSADSEDLYIDALPPQLFGPFDVEFDTDFILIAQTASVICRDASLIMRFEMV